MAQTGYTPIQLYYSTTAAAAPTSGNLASGELALNIQDEKLYFKNAAGTVKLLASNATTTNVASFQTSLGGLTPSTATTGIVTLAGTLNTSSGGTGLTTFTAGDLAYYASGTALTKLGIGTAGQILTSSGTAPQWSTLSGVAVTTISFGTTGLTPATATSGAVTVAGTLATANGGTNLTTFTSGGAMYATSTSVLTTGTLPVTAGGTGLATITAGRILYGAGTSALGNSASLFWDSANSRFGVGTATPAVTTELVGTDAMLIPKGTTGNRPTGVSGYLRFNTTSTEFEGYNGTAWASVGGAALSNDTTTATNIYPLSAAATTGTASTVYTSNANFLYKPSTGDLSAIAHISTNGITLNANTIATSYTIAATNNGLSAGPVSINGGVTITVSTGSVWTVI